MNLIKSLIVLTLLSIPSSSREPLKLEAVAAEILNQKPTQIKLKKQNKGMTSAGNYLLELNGEKYIFKVFGKKQDKKSRENEIDSVKIFSDLGIGAKLIGVSKYKSSYVREHIPGKTLKYKDMQDANNIKKLACVLRKLHSYKSEITAKTHEDRAEKHYKRAIKNNTAFPVGYDKEYESYKKQYHSLPKEEVFCHNDLNPHNIVLGSNGTFYFIDVVNSGNSNLYAELGYVTLLTGITGKNLEIFLEEYFGRVPTKDELNFVKLSQKLVCFLTSVVWFDFSESKRDKDTKFENRVKTLDEMLKSNGLKTGADLIKEDAVESIKSRDKSKVKQCAICFYKSYLES